jgi:hypothetical protein
MTAPAGRGDGPADRYLDELFDLLAGTGADGRRLLVEAEEHLTEAAAEGRARGLDAEAAEREAVDRFGPAATIARRVPGGDGVVRLSLRRLTTGAWAFLGTTLAWFGLTGALVRLLSEPWTRLLIATDRFGASPMCDGSGLSPAECLQIYRSEVALLPGVDNGFPYPVAAGLGVVLVVALLILRRTTALGAPRWTPSRRAAGLVFAVPFGLTGVGLLIEAIDGVTKDVQYYVLTDVVAGLFASVIGAVALRRALRPGSPVTAPDRSAELSPSSSH